jgi:hypothetical protein
MYGGFSFEQDAMRAQQELQDALSSFQQPQMPPMRMPQPQQPQMGMQQPQMPGQMPFGMPQMGQMPPQQQMMPQMGMQQQMMPPQQPQMGMQQQPMQPPMGPQSAFAVNPQQYAKGGAVKGAWTRKEGKNPEGGLNAKGRASLKAQGQDIKPPVSSKQAAKSPKAAARRKSFCARMGGMEGPMKDESGKPTRKALALRKWDCRAEGGLIDVEGRRITPSPDLLSLQELSRFELPSQGGGGGGGMGPSPRMAPQPAAIQTRQQMPIARTSGYVGPTLRGDNFQISAGAGRRGSLGVGGRLAFKEGGLAVWDKDRPDDLAKPKALSVKKKSAAKRRAKAAGRPYPNLVDNIAAARKKGK